jgi:stage II sporulation protein AB (anti-sigma F factor)
MINSFELKCKAILSNELLIRNALIAFLNALNLSIDEIGELKTLVSEGFSNAIIHGYNFDANKDIIFQASYLYDELTLHIIDYGKGIEDITQAQTPHFTSRPDLERVGMGLTIIASLSDSLIIESKSGEGTHLIIQKKVHPHVIIDE